MNAHEYAEKLFIEAEKLGMDKPSENMVSEAMMHMLTEQRQEIEYCLRDAGHTAASEYLERLYNVRHIEESLTP